MQSPALEVPDSLLTEKKVSQWMTDSVSHVRKMRRDGTGPPFIRLGEKLIRYRRTDVEEWLAAQRQQPVRKAPLPAPPK